MSPVIGHKAALSLPSRIAVAEALRNATYEVLPFKSAEEKVIAHVPKDIKITVTTTAVKGLRPTLDLAVSLRRHGYVVGPHLAARQVKDRAELADIVAELKDAGVGSLFVIGGDADEPAGDFPDALSLLRVLNETGHPFEWIGIGGYPEGHGKISDELIEAAMEAKAPYATQIITQLCYHGDTLLDWARLVKSRGIDVPIRVGIPGSMSRQKLIRVSASLGLGQSARFLIKQQSMLWRFFMPGGYSPNKLVNRLAPHIGTSELNLRGFHVFTFNDLDSTEHWRQSWLTKLAA